MGADGRIAGGLLGDVEKTLGKESEEGGRTGIRAVPDGKRVDGAGERGWARCRGGGRDREQNYRRSARRARDALRGHWEMRGTYQNSSHSGWKLSTIKDGMGMGVGADGRIAGGLQR